MTCQQTPIGDSGTLLNGTKVMMFSAAQGQLAAGFKSLSLRKIRRGDKDKADVVGLGLRARSTRVLVLRLRVHRQSSFLWRLLCC